MTGERGNLNLSEKVGYFDRHHSVMLYALHVFKGHRGSKHAA